VQILLDA